MITHDMLEALQVLGSPVALARYLDGALHRPVRGPRGDWRTTHAWEACDGTLGYAHAYFSTYHPCALDPAAACDLLARLGYTCDCALYLNLAGPLLRL